MTRARRTLIALDTTSYYHISVKTVRDCFLCGRDKSTGRNFEHRKQWLQDELLRLSEIFAIDVSAFAIMSNHYHVILHVNKTASSRWNTDEILTRWHRLTKGTPQSRAYLNRETLEPSELTLLNSQISTWLQRLTDISWFMRVINEKIARLANAEDGCTGRFWQGRFRSRALLDEKALLACMAYVDLNPIRAKIAQTPETSAHTSAQLRIDAIRSARQTNDLDSAQPKALQRFSTRSNGEGTELPFKVEDYLELLDWTGRQIRKDKRGHIDHKLPPLMNRLDIGVKQWLYLTKNYDSCFKYLVGTAVRVRVACKQLGWQRSHGISMCKALIG